MPNVGDSGVGIDLNGTTNSISSYLDSVANGGQTQASIEVSTGTINPQISSTTDVSKYVVIGSWTVDFFPGPSNGNGANIRIPASFISSVACSQAE